ncbi:MAG: hypothetical protein ACI9LM_004375 [Alteromonadaceae bacterium]|jgi:hypothetical protein
MKHIFLLFSLAFSLTIALLSTPASSEDVAIEENFSQAALAQILAPIALYPDSLLTHILIASTYPLEIIEADRWATKNSTLPPARIANKIEDLDWEPSVKALIPFPRILKRLSKDLNWTRQLGDAFLQDETQVLHSIQVLRKQAELAGSLDQMENMTVSKEDDNIIIQPVQQEVVYVPYYDTRVVYGPWHWSSYPPVHWRHHDPRYAAHHNLFSWHSGIHISVDYFFSAFHWSDRHVVVVDHYNSHNYRQRRHIVTGHYAKRWHHKPHHRRGVAYRNSVTKERYASNRPSVSQSRQYRDKFQPTQGRHHDTHKRLMASNHTRGKHNKFEQGLRESKVPSFNRAAVNNSRIKNKAVTHTQKNKNHSINDARSQKSRNTKFATNHQKTFKSTNSKRSEKDFNKHYSPNNKPKQQYKSSTRNTRSSTIQDKNRQQSKPNRTSSTSRTNNKSHSKRNNERENRE